MPIKQQEKNLLGANCDEAITAKKSSKYTNISKNGEKLFDSTGSITCDGNLYWFYGGADAGSQKAWEILYHKANNPTGKQTLSDGSELYLCLGDEYKTESLMTKCINDNEKAGCENKITKRIASKENGYFKAQDSGAIPCTNEYWFCNGSNKGTEALYNESECGKPGCIPMPEPWCESAPGHPNCDEWANQPLECR